MFVALKMKKIIAELAKLRAQLILLETINSEGETTSYYIDKHLAVVGKIAELEEKLRMLRDKIHGGPNV